MEIKEKRSTRVIEVKKVLLIKKRRKNKMRPLVGSHTKI